MSYKSIGILEVPLVRGQKQRGTEKSPSYFYEQGFHKLFKNSEVDLVKSNEDITYETLYKESLKLLEKKHDLSFFIGGDHSMAFSTIAAFCKSYSKRCVLWVDAHPDMNTPDTSPSGNIHGMPLAGLLGLFQPQKTFPEEFSWYEPPYLLPSEVVLLSIRDIDEGEARFLKEHKIHTLPFQKGEDFSQTLQKLQNIFQIINPEKHPLHLSFDIDGVDPRLAPSTGTPVRGGLNLEEVLQLMSYLKSDQNLVSLDLAEFNPCLSHQEAVLKTYEVFEKAIQKYLES